MVWLRIRALSRVRIRRKRSHDRRRTVGLIRQLGLGMHRADGRVRAGVTALTSSIDTDVTVIIMTVTVDLWESGGLLIVICHTAR